MLHQHPVILNVCKWRVSAQRLRSGFDPEVPVRLSANLRHELLFMADYAVVVDSRLWEIGDIVKVAEEWEAANAVGPSAQ